jgi:signal transduction histidine kinase
MGPSRGQLVTTTLHEATAKNLARLARLGLQTIGNHHDVNRDLNHLECMLRDHISGREMINGALAQRLVEQIRNGLSVIARARYQAKQPIATTLTSVSGVADRVQKLFGARVVVNQLTAVANQVKIPGAALLQMLLNLVDNAVRHSQSQTCRITLGEAFVTVSDDGPGIPKEDHQRIFELFSTTRSLTDKDDSGGIGLFVVKEHADAFGIQIRVENGTIMPGANISLAFPKEILQ